MSEKLYHYKNGHKFEPVLIAAEDETAWNVFCQRIALQHPHDPHPYWEDVVRFRKEREKAKPKAA